MKHYDVAIIGAGSAGLSARREVAKETDNYVVIDAGKLGTTCARVGCMPSKVLIEVANTFDRRKVFEQMGIKGADKISVDQALVMDHVRSLRDRFVRSVRGGMEEWEETKLIRKRASFIDENTLDLGDEKITAKSIIVGSGSRPIVPGAWTKYQDYFISTDEFFELETLPKKIAVIGLGVIGVELGQALSRLGVEVIGLTIGKSIGGTSDPEIQDYIGNTLSHEFHISYEGADLIGEENGQLKIKSGDEIHLVDKAFLTMGRRANVDNMGLENLNIDLDERKIPITDKSNYLIKGTKDVYLVGDVNGDRPLLHEASDEGRIAGFNAVREKKQCFKRREFLAITFSDPNIAVVGKGYKQLQDEGVEFVTGKVSYEGFGRAIVKLKEKGLLHIYVEKKSGHLLGAELFAPSGEHMAHQLAWVISLGLDIHQVLSLPFYHPVMEESLRTAFRDAARQVETPAGALEVLRCQDPPVGVRS